MNKLKSKVLNRNIHSLSKWISSESLMMMPVITGLPAAPYALIAINPELARLCRSYAGWTK